MKYIFKTITNNYKLIPQETITQIFDTADIVEVISDFINLKKSGSNYKGLSPFSNEKTPSFMVSPSKRIFKDFSSGKGGNVISFLMEHEHLSYPEALKWLANKYNIEITEDKLSEEQIKKTHDREALYLANKYANEFFKNELKNTNEGKSVGLSYYKKRGYNLNTIENFELGYSPEKSNAISQKATKDNYPLEPLLKCGIIKKNEKGTYDFFRGRVIFPIHNISGRIIGFGARTLKNDKKTAKYFNSPESDIYNKSQVLYGLYQAKNEIIKKDCCFLVEGYTDVITLHNNNFKNTVSSSGTSLTDGQIKLIKRFTKNIVILYDGDDAGINASFRSVDMILSAGLNIQVVVFPEGEDPDSYSNKISSENFKKYIDENQVDFITFKANHLFKKTKNDPINISKTINEIIQSISVIPDPVSRSIYIKTTSQIFEMDEQILISEVKKNQRGYSREESRLVTNINSNLISGKKFQKGLKHDLNTQEKDLIRLMLNYGALSIPLEIQKDNGETHEEEYPLAQFIIEEMLTDNLFYKDEKYQKIFNEFIDGLENGLLVNDQHFVQNPDLTSIVADLTTTQNIVSENWKKKHQIHTRMESERLKQAAVESVFIYKLRVTENLILDKQQKLKIEDESKNEDLLIKEIQELIKVRNIFAKELGIIVTQ